MKKSLMENKIVGDDLFNVNLRIQALIQKINKYRDSYYNDSKSLISDYEYDCLFDELKLLEKETGVIYANSPTQTVGYEVKSKLTKVKHSHPMLSLDKTKSIDDLIRFSGNKDCFLMHKLDGLTVLLTYDNGELQQAETRGNGIEGEIITHNAKVFSNIPLSIPYKGKLEIEGEAIITYDDFENINKTLTEEDRYKNPRNLVSGSVRQLNNEIAANRNVKFIAWKVPYIEYDIISPVQKDIYPHFNRMFERMDFIATELGFTIVDNVLLMDINKTKECFEENINNLRKKAILNKIPIDGLVITYDDIEYGLSLGQTSHHPKHSLAFKFYDEIEESTLLDIEWTVGKTGQITPTAVFEPIELEGTTVERASLHNISIIKNLGIGYKNQKINVYKANAVIPQIASAEDISTKISTIYENGCKLINGRELTKIYIPLYCPVCGEPCEIVKEENSNTEVLVCNNKYCKGKAVALLNHFCSKDAMNIDGFSEAKITKLFDLGLICDFYDIYRLNKYKNTITELEGFGDKSVENLLSAIEKSKNTTLNRFIYSLSIPNVGKSASKTISNYFKGDFNSFFETVTDVDTYFDWTILPDFGDVLSNSINNYFKENHLMVKELADIMNFKLLSDKSVSNILENKTFCITGSLDIYNNRNELVEDIEKYGGKVVSGVSKKINYLITNDTTSGSSKNKKAQELNIPIITEEEFKKMIG